MAILDKYTISTKPPKIRKRRAMADPMKRVNEKFRAGLEKQLEQAKAWKPGAKDLRSWVTRDESRGLAWVTVKYGPWPIPVKGRSKSTIGPVKLEDVVKVFDDIKEAHAKGELGAALKKVALKGPRKKKSRK